MIADILNTIGWIGVPGVLFLAFIGYSLVKGGNNKKKDNSDHSDHTSSN